MTTSFAALGLSPKLVSGLAKQDILEPTAIQQEAIPVMLKNLDVIGLAFTGSGKTLAYLCPLFTKLDPIRREVQGLILAPTHELVMQIYHQVQLLATNSGLPLNAVNIMGEANLTHQMAKLKEKPQIIVGTPGRVLDLIKKRKINTQTIKTVIIDEVDNLLDNTNRQAVLDIIKSTQRDRQLSAFSASLSDNTLRILREQMTSPKLVKVTAQVMMNPHIAHFYLIGEQRDKFELLRKLIHATDPERALIFLNDGERIDLLAEKLNYHGLKTFALYGEVAKEERKKALDDFRKGTVKLLVSSDLAARGLDIPDITHIINMDFPLEPNEYIHRAGRTARGERHGRCYSIVNPTELAALRVYQRTFDITVEPVHLVKGKVLPGTTKQFYSKSAAEKQNTAQKSSTGKKAASKKNTNKNTLKHKGEQKDMDKAKQKEILDKVRKAKNPNYSPTNPNGKNTNGFKPGGGSDHSHNNKRIGNQRKGNS